MVSSACGLLELSGELSTRSLADLGRDMGTHRINYIPGARLGRIWGEDKVMMDHGP